MAVVESGPTQVQRVLAKGPIPNAFPTLEQARNDPGRLERILWMESNRFAQLLDNLSPERLEKTSRTRSETSVRSAPLVA